jgi:hypothetical protein
MIMNEKEDLADENAVVGCLATVASKKKCLYITKRLNHTNCADLAKKLVTLYASCDPAAQQAISAVLHEAGKEGGSTNEPIRML